MTCEQEYSEHSHKYHYCIKKPSWTAVFVGALVGVGISFLLNLFSIAISLSALKTTAGVSSIAIGGLIGIAIGTIASMFVGGWTAGYLGRPYCVKRNLGVLYGFTTWCIALLITILVSVPSIKYMKLYTNFISNPASLSVANMMPAAAPDSTNPTQQAVVVNNITTLASGAFIIFVLMFLGAFSSCIGGHCGMTHRCKETDDPNCDLR